MPVTLPALPQGAAWASCQEAVALCKGEPRTQALTLFWYSVHPENGHCPQIHRLSPEYCRRGQVRAGTERQVGTTPVTRVPSVGSGTTATPVLGSHM
jgi:hypothetical protein